MLRSSFLLCCVQREQRGSCVQGLRAAGDDVSGAAGKVTQAGAEAAHVAVLAVPGVEGLERLETM